VLVVLGSVGAGPASAQSSLFLVDDRTVVRSLRFEVSGDDVLGDARRVGRMATRGPTALARFQNRLAWLPLVRSAAPPPFDPIELQRDMVRLRRFYREQGFPGARIDYRAALDEADNALDLTVDIDPGAPRVLAGVDITVPEDTDTVDLRLPALRSEAADGVGARFGNDELATLRDDVLAWAQARGHPFPALRDTVIESDDGAAVTVRVTLDPGAKARVRTIEIEAGPRLDDATIRRQLLVRPGDVFSPRRIDESVRQLLDLDLVQLALVEPVPTTGADSAVDLSVRVVEGTPRLVGGRLGYTDDRGLLSEGRWENRSFLGGGRTFEVSALAETGVFAFDDFPKELYGLSFSLDQPDVFDPRVSLLAAVTAEYEDSRKEEARSLGLDVSLLWDRGPQRFVSLDLGFTLRDVIVFRGGGLGTLGFLDALRRASDLEGSAYQGTASLTAGWGVRDDVALPTRGWSVTASLTGAGLDPWSVSQYVRAETSGAVLRSLWPGGLRVLGRVRAGRLFPVGRSRSGDLFQEYLRLGDAVFTAGGTGTVRGWERDLLGPKLPDIRFDVGADTASIRAGDVYLPLGGLAQVSGSVELQLPVFGSASHALAFLDLGRVWTPDDRFLAEDAFPLLNSEDDLYYGVGGGIALASPVGLVRVMLGYKINPSELDLINPEDVARVVLDDGFGVDDLEDDPWRRWRLHFAIGQAF
jgi:outer membrane protein insertion porin family